MLVTLLVLGITIFLFIQGKVRADLVALTALVVLMVSDVLTPEEALSGFSNPVVVMMIGLFIVGGGVLQTGLAQLLSRKMLGVAGPRPFPVYLLVMGATSLIGAFVSNTGTVALMLPIVAHLALASGVSSSRLLMPMAFASSMGGMMTLIGTPPNLIISNELVQAGFPELAFFSFAPVGIVVVIVGTLALWFLSKKFLNKRSANAEAKGQGKSLGELTREYHLHERVFTAVVSGDSPLIGKRIGDLDIARVHGVLVLEIEEKITRKAPFSKPVRQKIAAPETVIRQGNVLFLSGSEPDIRRFVETAGLVMRAGDADGEGAAWGSKHRSVDDIGIAELVIQSNAKLVNRPIRDSGLGENYQMKVLGIQRNNQYILQDLKNEKIQAGDALLVHGSWESIARLGRQMTGIVVLGQPEAAAAQSTLDHKAPLAALIMVGMIACMVMHVLPAVTAVMLAAILMVFTGCLRNVEAAFQTIHWETVLLIGAMLPMSVALEKTGVSEVVSQTLVAGLGNAGPIYLLAGIYVATSVLTLFINNTATAVLFAPIALHVALGMGLSPYPFLFAVTVAASMCFASPFSTPPNALVMSAGRYTFLDYVKVGLPLQILLMLLMLWWLPLLFPFHPAS